MACKLDALARDKCGVLWCQALAALHGGSQTARCTWCSWTATCLYTLRALREPRRLVRIALRLRDSGLGILALAVGHQSGVCVLRGGPRQP